MGRFFVEDSKLIDIEAGTILITGDESEHIRKVLRLRAGDRITVCDGKCTDFTVELKELLPNAVKGYIIEKAVSATEPPVEITIYQGIPKGDKFDLIIQKCTELGACRFVPVMTDNTVVRLGDARDAQKKCIRWQRVALEAAKQCNRGIVPQVDMPVDFMHAVEAAAQPGAFDLALIPYENERQCRLGDIFSRCPEARRIAFFIGPEGGFAPTEIQAAMDHGISPITLGPRILRTETAGLVVTALLMQQYGDI